MGMHGQENPRACYAEMGYGTINPVTRMRSAPRRTIDRRLRRAYISLIDRRSRWMLRALIQGVVDKVFRIKGRLRHPLTRVQVSGLLHRVKGTLRRPMAALDPAPKAIGGITEPIS